MNRWILPVTAAAVWLNAVGPLPATEQKRPVSLLAQLEAEFQGQQFITKIVVASEFKPHAGRPVSGWVSVGPVSALVVDTELERDGTLRYLVPMRQAGTILTSSFSITPEEISRAIPPGTRVAVTKVELKDDRVELSLSGPNEVHGKLKIMLDDRFQRSMSLDDVLVFVGRALRIDRLERIQTLVMEYKALVDKLSAFEAAWAAATSATGRLNHAKDVQAILQVLVDSETEYAKLRRTTRAPIADEYERRLQEVSAQIPALDMEARKERLAELHARLAAAGEEAKEIRLRVGSPAPKNRAEWNDRAAALERWEANLAGREELLKQVAAEGDTTAAAAQAGLAEERHQLVGQRDALAQDQRRVDLTELDSEYRALDRQRVHLLDAYTRVFGSATQAQAADALLTHLQRMQENRLAAQKLGSSTAPAQAAKIKAEMDRIRRR